MPRRSSLEVDDSPETAINPHAVKVDAAEFKRLVSAFYGTKTLLFDKALAEAVMAYNSANRPINRRKVERLVAQMQGGTFENTGEPVILSAEGVLNDGQHRLAALIEADVTVDMDVRFGIARKAFTKTNTGSSRTSADVLAIRGVAGGSTVAPAVRLLILYRRGLPASIREFVPNAEVDDSFQKWKGIEVIGKQVAGYAFPRGVRSTPLLATAFLASRSPAKDKLNAWLKTLATGLTSRKTDPAYILRERLMRGVDAAIGTRESLVERFALMIISWTAFAADQGMTGKDLKWTATGRVPMPFPKVEGARL